MSVSLSQLMKAQVTEGMISCDTELDYCLLASQGRSQAGHYARLVLPTQPRLVQDGALTLSVYHPPLTPPHAGLHCRQASSCFLCTSTLSCTIGTWKVCLN